MSDGVPSYQGVHMVQSGRTDRIRLTDTINMTTKDCTAAIRSGKRSGSGSDKARNKGDSNPFWNLIQLDQTRIDKELDTAALRAYERLRFARNGRPHPQVDIEDTNKKTTEDVKDESQKVNAHNKNSRKSSRSGKDRDRHPPPAKSSRMSCQGQGQQAVASEDKPRRSDSNHGDGMAVTLQTDNGRGQRSDKKNQPDKKQNSRSRRTDDSKSGKSRSTASRDQGSNHGDQVNGRKEGESDLQKDPAPRKEKSVDQRGVTEDGAQKMPSTLPTESKVQFLWARTVPTKATSITLKIESAKDSVPLHYVATRDAYMSAEVRIPCATYQCCLLVDKQEHRVEKIDIKHYTFEVDLYIEEDEDIPQSSDPPQLTTQRQHHDTATRGSAGDQGHRSQPQSQRSHGTDDSKPVLRSQRSLENHKETPVSNERDVRHSLQGPSPHTSSGTSAQHTAHNHDVKVAPSTDLAEKSQSFKGSDTSAPRPSMEDVLEGEDGSLSNIRHSSRLEQLLRQQMASGDSVTNGTGTTSSGGLKSTSYPGSMERLHQQLSDGLTPGVLDKDNYSGSVGSRQSVASSEQELTQYLESGDRHRNSVKRDASRSDTVSVHSIDSRPASSGHSHSMEAATSDSGGGHRRQNGDITPTPNNTGEYSYTSKEYTSRGHYTHRNEADARSVNSDLSGGVDRPHNGIRSSTPSRDHRPPSDFRDMTPSYDSDRRSEGYITPQRFTPTFQNPSELVDRDRGYADPAPRSLPGHLSSHIQPAIRAPLVTSRTVPLSTRETELPPGREDQHRTQDLEDTISSLRRVLTNREKDLNEIQTERAQLSEEVTHLKQIYETPTEGRDEKEKRINQLIREKENLTTEVWKLKRDMDQLKAASKLSSMTDPGHPEQSRTDDHVQKVNHLDNYSPNNPRALQRKIEDLESQLQDLNEAHESTVTKLGTTEKEVTQLKEENRGLTMASVRHQDGATDRDSQQLRDELVRYQDEDGEYLRHELSKVKNDLRSLRDRNRQLMADNIKLTEHLKGYKSSDPEVIHQRSQSPDRREVIQQRSQSPDRREVIQRSQSPERQYRRPDPAIQDPTHWSSPKLTHEEEQFRNERQRLTRELRELSTPPTWSDRDYRNHGDEGPYIRTANQDPFRRVRSVSPGLHQDRHPERHTDRHQDRHTDRHTDRHSDRHPDRLPDRLAHTGLDPQREDTYLEVHHIQHSENRGREISRHDDHLERRSRSPERRLVNGYHRSVTPPSRRERHLSSNSDTTVELTDASPLGGQHQRQDPQISSEGPQITRIISKLTQRSTSPFDLDLTPPPHKSVDPIDDVMDRLSHPSTTRSRLKVDLVDDIIDGNTRNRTNTQNSQNHEQSEKVKDDDIHLFRHYKVDSNLDHQLSAKDHSLPQTHNTSSHSSVLDDLLDNSLDDPVLPPWGSRRRDSVDSDSTEVILGIAEEEMNRYNIEREKGCDQYGSGSPRGGRQSPKGLLHGTSLRSVSPRAVVTQHNKGSLGASLVHRDSVHSYASKRPFAPRVAADVSLGDVVKFCRHGGKISRGLVKYVGHLPGKNDTYLGLELEHEMGKHDGIYEGQRYFQSKPNRGVFVAFSKVVMAWGD